MTPDLTPPTPTTPARRLARLLGAPLRWLVALGILVRDLVAALGGPLWRALARLRPLVWLSRWVSTLPRWGVLLVLALPFSISEPLKLIGVYVMATGQVKLGVGLQILGHAISILLVERIVTAGLPQLLTWRWFAWGWGWYEAIRMAVARWPIVVAAREATAEIAAKVRAARAQARAAIAKLREAMARFRGLA